MQTVKSKELIIRNIFKEVNLKQILIEVLNQILVLFTQLNCISLLVIHIDTRA